MFYKSGQLCVTIGKTLIRSELENLTSVFGEISPGTLVTVVFVVRALSQHAVYIVSTSGVYGWINTAKIVPVDTDTSNYSSVETEDDN